MRRATRRPTWRAAGLAVVGAVGLSGCGAVGAGQTSAPSGSTSDRQPDLTTPGPDEDRYRDGDYTATGWYGGLPSHIVVELTLRDDVIAAVEVTPTATNETSLDLQQRFAEAVADVVVGRPLDEIELDYLAGSSGTTLGFNDALEQIRAQASR